MTTNLAECMKFVLKGARSLPNSTIIKTTFERTKSWFVERGLKTKSMLRSSHQYVEDIATLLKKTPNNLRCVMSKGMIEKILKLMFNRFPLPTNTNQCLTRLD